LIQDINQESKVATVVFQGFIPALSLRCTDVIYFVSSVPAYDSANVAFFTSQTILSLASAILFLTPVPSRNQARKSEEVTSLLSVVCPFISSGGVPHSRDDPAHVLLKYVPEGQNQSSVSLLLPLEINILQAFASPVRKAFLLSLSDSSRVNSS
jgi:hypothetical protein